MIGDFKRKKDFLTIEFYFDLGRVRRVKYPIKTRYFYAEHLRMDQEIDDKAF